MGLVVVKRTVADNPRDIALKIKEAIMSADGYSYRLQATSHQTIATRYTFYCSQNSKLTTYKRPKENPTRRRHPPTRFDCHGGLTVFVPTDPHSLYCGFKYEHGRFHPRVKNRKVSEPLKEYIQSNLELTAKDIYAKFKKIKDQFPKDQHISQAQVYYWWHEFREGKTRQVKKNAASSQSTVPSE
ncbi:hypothetical protein BKA69DRAFT_1125006 [Paraphysoderma sedebokerense]|nr:hypothetical protein BKA69DRAFT_1125006 [Paraphysoderma sedebokerense]